MTTRIPETHHARSHATLALGLASDARVEFAARGRQQSAWDPRQATAGSPGATIDLGRGLLDSVALALHVLWTYQQAWAEEGFLSTARLPTSVAKLLSIVGYHGGPGAAATGLQHLHAKAGVRDVLVGAGVQLSSAPLNDEAAALYETLQPIRLDTRLNEMKPFLPKSVAKPGGGGKKGHPSANDGEPKSPAPKGGLFGAGSAAKGVEDRIDVQRHGAQAARAAARARQDARQLASMINKFGLDKNAACGDSLESLCEKLCAAQKAAADAGMDAGKPAPLSEEQEILARLLRNLARRQKDAIAELECAMAPCEGENPKDYAKRLDCLTAFLEALIGAMIQEARDQVVLLRGPGALDNLDRAFGGDAGRAPPRGLALPGGDFLYLLAGDDGQAAPVRPGDWLVVAEDVKAVAPDGSAKTVRAYREAIRVVRASREVPTGTRQSLVKITFSPALSRRYRLDDVTLLGNIVPISEGKAVVEQLPAGTDPRLWALGQSPLTWLRDVNAPNGRRPEISVTVDGRAWHRVDDLLAQPATAPVFACEAQPDGKARLRFGDGENGAQVRAGARVIATYRIGLGAGGERAGSRIAGLASSNPAIESTFNPLPTIGGADPEPFALARARGPASVGTLDRAVSVHDVQVLALDYDGIRRARVFRDPRRPRSLTVVVAGPRTAALPAADLAALRSYLAIRVPPGVDVSVENRILVPVRLKLHVKYAVGADPITLLQQIRERLGVEAHAGSAPGLLDPERVKLGDDLELSEIYSAVDGVRGLFSMVVVQLHRAKHKHGLHERVVAGPREMLVWAAPDPVHGDGVEIAYEEGRDR